MKSQISGVTYLGDLFPCNSHLKMISSWHPQYCPLFWLYLILEMKNKKGEKEGGKHFWEWEIYLMVKVELLWKLTRTEMEDGDILTSKCMMQMTRAGLWRQGLVSGTGRMEGNWPTWHEDIPISCISRQPDNFYNPSVSHSFLWTEGLIAFWASSS